MWDQNGSIDCNFIMQGAVYIAHLKWELLGLFLLLVGLREFFWKIWCRRGENKKDYYSFFQEIFLNVYVGREIKKIIIILKFKYCWFMFSKRIKRMAVGHDDDETY
jgi:hypothetical protein